MVNSFRLSQPPTFANKMIATRPTKENQPILLCPLGTMINAANKGPSDVPALPPTWNIDWASPCRPPEAMRASREASGWKTDDPMPTSPAEQRIMEKLLEMDKSSKPKSVSPMPMAKEYGFGR